MNIEKVTKNREVNPDPKAETVDVEVAPVDRPLKMDDDEAAVVWVGAPCDLLC